MASCRNLFGANTQVGSYAVTAFGQRCERRWPPLPWATYPVPRSLLWWFPEPRKPHGPWKLLSPIHWWSRWSDTYGNPVPGVNVTYLSPGGGATGTFSNGLTAITATTNASGQLSQTFTANSVVGGYFATASVAGVATPASFTLINMPLISRLVVLAISTTKAGNGFAFSVVAVTPANTIATNYNTVARFDLHRWPGRDAVDGQCRQRRGNLYGNHANWPAFDHRLSQWT